MFVNALSGLGAISEQIALSPEFIGINNQITVTTIVWPTHQIGDLLVFIASGRVSYLSTPAGWTLLNNSGNNVNQFVYWKVAASSSETIAPALGSPRIYSSMVFRNAEIGNSSFTNSTSSSSMPDISCTEGSIILNTATTARDSNTSLITTATNSSLADITFIQNISSQSSDGGGSAITRATATGTTTGSTTMTNATLLNIQGTIEIKYKA